MVSREMDMPHAPETPENTAKLASWLETVDVWRAPVLAELVMALARAVDADSDTYCERCGRSSANAAIWREYRVALGELVAAMKADEAEDDGEATLLEIVRTSLGDTADPVA